MPDREKIIKNFEDYEPYARVLSVVTIKSWVYLDALELLKEQEERGKGICKRICDFIRGSCSVDTEADKEYVCHVIQQIFIKGSW